MKKLPKKQLKELFENLVSQSGAKCSDGNPFFFQKKDFKCYVFIKNISPAYFPNYPDNSRVQLPSSDSFKEIIKSELDFHILGYDKENEVYGAWNPNTIKKRLNEKQNVSVYSRFSWQKSIPPGEFIEKNLGNEEKILLFKKELLNQYFDHYLDLFSSNKFETGSKKLKDLEEVVKIKTIKNIIIPLLKKNKVLQAVSELESKLKSKPEYESLSFKDYFKIVNQIYKDMNS